MSSSLEEAIKEAYALAPSNIAILETIEISHPLTSTIYLVKRTLTNLSLTLEDSTVKIFTACGFDLVLPEKNGTGLQQLQIAIDNIDQVITDFINVVKDSTVKITVKYRPYLSNNYTTPQMNPPLTLWMTDITVTDTQVTANCTFMDIINKPFPSINYGNQQFPSLGQ